MGIDQAHEQNNRKVKVEGRAVGIFDKENAMLDWSVAGPVIADMIADYYENDETDENEENKEKEIREEQKRTMKTLLNRI